MAMEHNQLLQTALTKYCVLSLTQSSLPNSYAHGCQGNVTVTKIDHFRKFENLMSNIIT